MRKSHEPKRVNLTCCGKEVTVTGRPSRIMFRPERNHRCPACGKHFKVNANTLKMVEA